MPRFDGTGPMGKGPMSGRGMGFCLGSARTDRTRGLQMGRGIRASRRGGSRFFAYGPWSGWGRNRAAAAQEAPQGPPLPSEEELSELRSLNQRLAKTVQRLEERIRNLETS